MARFFDSGKGKRRLVAALSILLSATLSLGIMSACNKTGGDDTEEEEKTPSATDIQLLKNGNFEFYGEMDEEDRDERRAFINSPTDWSFSSGSPSSDTSSGIVNIGDWDYMTKPSAGAEGLVPAEPNKDEDGKETTYELTDAVIEKATSLWEKASLYDRLKFYKYYGVKDAAKFELYGDYRYSVDFEDVQYLSELKNQDKLVHEGAEEGEESILMIHNRRTSDGIRGTSQSYTSSTTITLNAGTAAKVSVWVRTSELYHYASTADGENDVAVTARAGAYIGVTNTVGGTTLDQMQIKNINTQDEWQHYTIYIRANTFATTTFRIVLGLGQGTYDNRYESLDGYAFFDDVECELITGEDYAAEVTSDKYTPGKNLAGLDTKGDDRKFLATADTPENGKPVQSGVYNYALDLSKEFNPYDFSAQGAEDGFALTEERSGSKTYTSATIDPDNLGDTSKAAGASDRNNIARRVSLSEIENTTNGYLKKIYQDDFKDKFPSSFDQNNIILLLSTNGAAYTAKLNEIELAPKSRCLVSFFVKTSAIRSGKTGAGAILVDGDNKNTITPFDSTTVATVDINTDKEELTDIYKGWVQCFFFVENATEEPKSFHLELTYGPTAIAGTSKTDYSDGYAAFANFEYADLTKTQYSYATTGTYAQKVSLTASVKDESKFADAAANGTQLDEGLATPVGYTGVLAGSNVLVEGDTKNPGKEELATEYGIYTGLLSSDNAKTYLSLAEEEGYPNGWAGALNSLAKGATEPSLWWKNIFGNNGSNAEMAYQPLVIVNTSAEERPSYGFFASSTTVSANATSRISLRMKLSKDMPAYVYLVDVSDVNVHDKQLEPNFPAVTYWYDDEGNIVSKDPSSDGFDEKNDILFTLEENGLYKNAKDENDTKYYANLSAYGTPDDEGNLVTGSGTVAFYGNEGKFYAYYDKKTETFSQEVTDLLGAVPEASRRYTAPADPSKYAACIRVLGDGSDVWTTVSFYVEAGNKTKNYRLEIWAGQRDYQSADASEGLPANGYAFFDRVSTSSVSNYSALRSAAAEAMLDYTDEEGNYVYRDKTDETKLSSDYALYYTFTFFDSPSYLRYDATVDDGGDPWGSYKQSDYTEELSWLYVEDGGDLLGTATPTVSMFLSYAQNEKEVTPDETDSGSDNNSSSGSTSTNTDSNLNGANFWLLLSSILLAVALVFAVIAIFVRRLIKKYGKKTVKVKSKESKRTAPKAETQGEAPVEQPAAPAPAKKKAERPVDENDPYNE